MRKIIIAKKVITIIFMAFAIFAICIVYLAAQSGFFASAEVAEPQSSYPINGEGMLPIIDIQDTELDYNAAPQKPTIIVTLDGLDFHNFEVTYLKNGEDTPTDEPPINAGVYTVTVTTYATGDMEEVTASAQMTINRILPQISFSSLTPLTQTYSHYTPIIAYAGGVFGDGFYQEISVVTEFADEQPNAGSYAISTHFEGSTNYLPRQTEGTLIIAPKAIPVAFNPQWEYIYTGKPHSRTLQYDKDAFPSDLVIDVTYDGEPYGIECGVYQIALSANNPNYYLTYSLADLKMDIKKASLTIRLNNVVIMPGQDAQITYTYIGFVEGEGSEVLTALPRLTNRPTEPGVYQLVPQDAEAKNYTFNYMPGNYTVNQHSVTGELQNSDIKVLVTSSFHPGSAINFSKIDKDSESFTGLSSILRDRSQIYFNSDIVGAYNFNFSEGGLSGTNEYKASIFNVKLSPLFKHNIAVVDKGGNYHKIDNYVYKDNTIVFNFHVEGRIVIYRYSLLTYLVAGFIGLGALIIIIYKISSAISYRRTKKGEPEEQLVPQTPPPTKPRYDW